MSEEDLVERGRKLLRGVTEGPWEVSYETCHCGDIYGCSHGRYPYAFYGPTNVTAKNDSEATNEVIYNAFCNRPSEISELSDEDAEFMMGSRSLVPELLDEVEKLRLQLKEKKE